MTQIAIHAESLGKRYRLGEIEPYKTLRDALTRATRAAFRRSTSQGTAREISPGNPHPRGHIWALRGVSFEVEKGEKLGIIGPNGAGKTTLLKILSRITEPTEGRVELRGRVGSLLEVGTGFHPELTGRENVYLNGAILGMTKRQIETRYDEIVHFGELEGFMSTPVKRFSSGMYVRLAFAVAAHLEPEILLVDEVLAVGDIGFQKKCLGRMGEIAEGGRTVLFVSHQMNSIRKLCDRCIWLDGGAVRMDGSPPEVIGAYEASFDRATAEEAIRYADPKRPAQFLYWEFVEPREHAPNLLATTGPVRFKIILKVNSEIRDGVHGIALWNSDGLLVWGWAKYGMKLKPGTHEFVYALPGLPLRPGSYSWHVTMWEERKLLDEWHCVPPLIVGTQPLAHPRDEWSGILNLPCEFDLRTVE